MIGELLTKNQFTVTQTTIDQNRLVPTIAKIVRNHYGKNLSWNIVPRSVPALRIVTARQPIKVIKLLKETLILIRSSPQKSPTQGPGFFAFTLRITHSIPAASSQIPRPVCRLLYYEVGQGTSANVTVLSVSILVDSAGLISP